MISLKEARKVLNQILYHQDCAVYKRASVFDSKNYFVTFAEQGEKLPEAYLLFVASTIEFKEKYLEGLDMDGMIKKIRHVSNSHLSF